MSANRKCAYYCTLEFGLVNFLMVFWFTGLSCHGVGSFGHDLLVFLLFLFIFAGGTRWRSRLRHCATSRKVAGSISVGVIAIFHWYNSSGRTMALRLTQPLTEMSTRNISWGIKAAGAYGWQPFHLHVPIVLKSGSLNLLEPSGPVQTCNGIALPLFIFVRKIRLWNETLA